MIIFSYLLLTNDYFIKHASTSDIYTTLQLKVLPSCVEQNEALNRHAEIGSMCSNIDICD